MRYQQTNWLFDEVMPNAKPNTFKVVSAVVRKTWGWQKTCDEIGMEQFHNMTGIASRETLSDAIKDALEKGWIIRTKRGKTFRYAPNMTEELDINEYGNRTGISTETVPMNGDEYGNRTGISTETVPVSVRKPYTQYKEENIYSHPPPPDIAEMIAAIASVVKTPYGPGINEDDFEKAAYAVVGWNKSTADVKAFREWWREYGHYKGKPALKSFLQEINNIDTSSAKKLEVSAI